ncbi:hypothetical protein E2C01_065100 [Portunus trituberculatus]|uniref:Uncharacterized protein n=1 Tax=Portunus trituberculatus TaxID=210409 RepID=A0A5B7HES3_PORTR|nr:hypothetical protein [Portunus trituberculatus]
MLAAQTLKGPVLLVYVACTHTRSGHFSPVFNEGLAGTVQEERSNERTQSKSEEKKRENMVKTVE